MYLSVSDVHKLMTIQAKGTFEVNAMETTAFMIIKKRKIHTISHEIEKSPDIMVEVIIGKRSIKHVNAVQSLNEILKGHGYLVVGRCYDFKLPWYWIGLLSNKSSCTLPLVYKIGVAAFEKLNSKINEVSIEIYLCFQG